MDISSLMKLKQSWNTFRTNHPKFPEFINAIKAKEICEGTEISFVVTYPDGQTLRAGVKLKSSDVDMIKNLIGSKR